MNRTETTAAGRRTADHHLIQPDKSLREPLNNVDGNDNRYTISNTVFRNALAEPDQNHGSGRENADGHGDESESRICHQRERRIGSRKPEIARSCHGHRRHCALNHTDQNGKITSILIDSSPPDFPFTGKLFQRRNHRHKQLHDNRRGDVRHDTESPDCKLLQSAAAEQIEHTHELSGCGIRAEAVEVCLQIFSIHTRARNIRCDTAENDHSGCEENLISQLFDFECV